MTSKQKETELQKLINNTIIRSNREIDRAVLRAVTIISGTGKMPTNKAELKQYTAIYDELHKKLLQTIQGGIVSSNTLANNHIDKDVMSYLGGRKLDKKVLSKFMQRDTGALKVQLNRAIDGKTLSDRVWAISNTAKEGIENIVLSNVGESFVTGKSATKLATDLKQYLNNPDKRFRRIRNEAGKLVPSKPMGDYHPGQGVYRSSYKNSLRLSANEVNMSYRMAEHERVQNLDFVTGIEICLSNNHPVTDICDSMKGKYPKEYVFRGWHTLCRCYKKTILLSDEEFDKYLSGEVDDLKVLSKPYMVDKLPDGAVKYLNDKKEMFEGWKNKPYFLTDNEKFVSKPKEIIVQKPPKDLTKPIDISKHNNYESYPQIDKDVTALRKKISMFRDISNKDIISFAGDTPDVDLIIKKIDIGMVSQNDMRIKIETNKYESLCTISKYGKKLSVKIDHIDVLGDHKGAGIGARMFANILDVAEKNGFETMDLRAAKGLINGEQYNGYYTWARFGFELSHPVQKEYFLKLVQRSENVVIKNAKTLQELVKTEEGAAFWKNEKNGFDYLGIFDIKKDKHYFIEYFNSKFD